MTCRLTCDTEKFELLGGEGSHHLALSEVSVFHPPFPLTFLDNADFTFFFLLVAMKKAIVPLARFKNSF